CYLQTTKYNHLHCHFFSSSDSRHTRSNRDWSSDVCSTDLNPVEPAEISRLTSLIAHRGPFGEGTWFNAKRNVAFGHRRLAIIDRSEERRVGKGNQYKSYTYS